MTTCTTIDPDDDLDLSGHVEVTVDDVHAAWDRAYAAAAHALVEADDDATLYVVFGLQGAGKSTWVRAHAASLPAPAVVLTGPLPARRHRERAIALAHALGCACVGIWIDTPFEVAAARNAGRSGLRRIPDSTMRQVAGQLEPPSRDEGFDAVYRVGPDDRLSPCEPASM